MGRSLTQSPKIWYLGAMIKEIFFPVIEEAISILEVLGLVVIVYGSAMAIVQFVRNLGRAENGVARYLTRYLTLGLEFLVGAEILRTVVVRTFDELIKLGAIIALRGLLGFIIQRERETRPGLTEPNQEIPKTG
ncbi:MAG: DUF1622 domain-containing protein [Actinomycetota bacterium]|nr:DUF1622 domain-containing protein [Actinomycetota bacterium]